MRAGRASSVSDLGDGTVLRTGGRPAIEAAIMEVARAGGYPVPAVIAVRDDGLVLERIEGPTMGEWLARHPWELARRAGELAHLHHRLHRIGYEGERLVHFDLHPDNVLLSASGPVVIDWTNAHAGDPEADLAMTWLILATSSGLPGRVMAWLFARSVGRERLRRGLADAAAFRLWNPNVTPTEKERVRRARL